MHRAARIFLMEAVAVLLWAPQEEFSQEKKLKLRKV